MTPVSRARMALATLTALFGLACAAEPLAVASPPARASVMPADRTELECADLDSLNDEPGSGSPHRALSVLVRTASTSGDLWCIRRTVARFFPVMARERPVPQDLVDLPEWWRILGYIGAYVRDDPNVFVVMPEPIPRLDHAARARLAAVHCPENDASCGAEARTFLADAEEQMAELADLGRFEEFVQDASAHPMPGDAIAACASNAHKARRGYVFSAWRRCVERAVPQLVRTPSGSFRLPAQGVLATQQSGFWDPCSEVTGFSLSSGLALTKVECTLSDLNRSATSWRLSRASSSRARRIALFIALMDEMRSGPATAKAIPVPADVPRDDHAYATRSPERWISDVPTFAYSVHGVLANVVSGSVYAYDEVEPKQRFLARLLRTSQRVGATSCAEPQDQPVLAELLAKMFPNEPDLRALEGQVTRRVACRQ